MPTTPTSPRRRPQHQRRAGFTLMEVLLVLVILVALATLAVTAYGPIQRNAFIKNAKLMIATLEGNLDRYRLDMSEYPSTAQGLDALWAAPSDLRNAENWSGPYLKKRVPLDPWDNQYQYQYPGTHDNLLPDIWSFGPDGIDGTDDDIGNWMEN